MWFGVVANNNIPISIDQFGNGVNREVWLPRKFLGNFGKCVIKRALMARSLETWLKYYVMPEPWCVFEQGCMLRWTNICWSMVPTQCSRWQWRFFSLVIKQGGRGRELTGDNARDDEQIWKLGKVDAPGWQIILQYLITAAVTPKTPGYLHSCVSDLVFSTTLLWLWVWVHKSSLSFCPVWTSMKQMYLCLLKWNWGKASYGKKSPTQEHNTSTQEGTRTLGAHYHISIPFFFLSLESMTRPCSLPI